MRNYDPALSRLVLYLTANKRIQLNIVDQFHHFSDPLSKLNAAFLLILSSESEQYRAEAENYLQDCLESDDLQDYARFYYEALEQIQTEFSNLRKNNFQFDQDVLSAINEIKNNRSSDRIQEKIWEVFFPEAVGLTGSESIAISGLQKKRKISIREINPAPIKKSGNEILFTSNILLTMPLDMFAIATSNLDPGIKSNIEEIRHDKQKFWYDHPIPLGIPADKNEILYGMHAFDQAIDFEATRGNLSPDEKVTCVLSASVTHEGLHKIAKKYIEQEFNNHGKIKNLDIYVFTETDTDKIINEILVPAAKQYLDLNLDESDLSMFGVDGEYGRHYSFLKAISAFWQVLIDPEKKATFKIDLDQVFPQEVLVKETGASVFEHFTTNLWGATGIDSNGATVTLDMIAGALVNEKDISQSLFIPDVPVPHRKPAVAEQVFFSNLPQAISTEAEMMTKYESGDFDGINYCLQRVHVTGGTNGILIKALRMYMPFTPSFFGRAEDQAYIMSVFNENTERLAYLHKPGLIMRHDKEAFAQDAMAAARVGKMIGDYVRIVYFSAYAKLLDPDLIHIKNFLDPFTGCFISFIPKTVVHLRFALQAADLLAQNETRMAVEFITSGYRRIKEAIQFVENSDDGMTSVYQSEFQGWKNYYQILSAIESALQNDDKFSLQLKAKAQSICRQCLISCG
jgi:hypothetical protein